MAVMEENMTRRWLGLIVAFGLMASFASSAFAAMAEGEYRQYPNILQTPKTQIKSHTWGNMKLVVTNWGFFGNAGDFNKYVWSCEFPANSNQDYLFQGALWIGGIIENDTFVSFGADGWNTENEMFPGSTDNDTIIERSINPASPYYSDSTDPLNAKYGPAVSEQDFIAVYTDTVGQPYAPTEHRPLGLKITQQTYCWSYDYAQDFTLMKFWIENIRGDGKTIEDVYVALYIDADVNPVTKDDRCKWWGAQDDVTGFRVWRDTSDTLWAPGTELYQWVGGTYEKKDVGGKPKYQSPADYITVAWIADADGLHPEQYCKNMGYAASVTGTRVVYPPPKEISYNWWISDENEAMDWGPYHTEDPSDVKGTPMGDKAKYRIMSNGYFDPDQICSGVVYPPNVDSINDTRYLLSFGPNDLPAGDTLVMILAYVGGERFHNSEEYCDYNFEDLARNASWAYRVYDNPGVDTDHDGYAGDFTVAGGETLYLTGDGIPDFEGPPPPPTPQVKVTTGDQKVTIRWGKDSETYENKFIPAPYDTDYFEGYRVCRSESGRLGEFTLLQEYDRIDFDTSGTKPLFWNRGMPESIEVSGGETTYVYVDGPMLNYYPRFYSVSAFDKGYPPGYGDVLASLSTSPLSNAVTVTPSPTAEQAAEREVEVIPNPYKISNEYASIKWEDWEGAGWSEHTRRLDFINLPPKCTIRIYSLNGDLIRTLEHDADGNAAAGRAATAESWNLITRDVEAIVSGIYLFSVENKDTGKVQVGKFLVIK
jgi:hypothetical protein